MRWSRLRTLLVLRGRNLSAEVTMLFPNTLLPREQSCQTQNCHWTQLTSLCQDLGRRHSLWSECQLATEGAPEHPTVTGMADLFRRFRGELGELSSLSPSRCVKDIQGHFPLAFVTQRKRRDVGGNLEKKANGGDLWGVLRG